MKYRYKQHVSTCEGIHISNLPTAINFIYGKCKEGIRPSKWGGYCLNCSSAYFRIYYEEGYDITVFRTIHVFPFNEVHILGV